MARQAVELGGRSPEELETLLEDALVLGDRDAVARLFTANAVLVGDPDPLILVGPRRVYPAGDVVLVLREDSAAVARRCPDGSWRYAICVLPTPSGLTSSTVAVQDWSV